MTRRQLQAKKSLVRPSGVRRERKRILIVTESAVTEPQYFKGLAKALRATGVTVRGFDILGEGREPTGVVKRAASESEDGSLIGQHDGFDAVWCVFDVDEHEKLHEAILMANDYGFFVAISNPCFELWILWHYESHNAHATAKGLAKKLKKHGFSGKHIPGNFPYGSVDTAIGRAVGCTQDVPKNPGSRVWRLAKQLREES